MNRNTIKTIAKKEFASFVNSPLAYIVIVPFLFLSTLLYLRTALSVGEATLRPYFDLLPWFLLFVAPALSMKLFSDEYKANTLELLFAHPLSELEIVVGKFLGATAFFLLILATSVSLPLTLLLYANPDIGQMIGQYIGALFVGATFLAIGIAASSYIKQAVGSFLLSTAISFVLLIVGLSFISQTLPPPLSLIATEISLLTHMENVARGLLDIRDIAYFATTTIIFLLFAVHKLSERRLAEEPKTRRKLTTTFALVIAIGIVANVLLFFYPVRIDLTSNRLFSLSSGTKQTVKQLTDLLTITLFTSNDLPTEMQLTRKDIGDLLSDYKKLSNNIAIRIVYPDADPSAQQEAQSAGIEEVTFNKIASGKFEVQKGYLGLTLRYADKTETLAFIQDATDLEYQLTRRIRKLTSGKEETIGLAVNSFDQYTFLEELIKTQYTTKPVDLDAKGATDNISTLVVIDDGSTESTAAATAALRDYAKNNGHMLLLLSGVSINQQTLSAQKSRSQLADFLKDYGITRNTDLVYDTQLHEIISFGQGTSQYLSPYPYWLRALPAIETSPLLQSVKSTTLGWTSSLSLTDQPGITHTKLLTTSPSGGTLETPGNISPESLRTLAPSTGEQYLLAAGAEKDAMRLVVVANSTLATDQFLRMNPDNSVFLANALDYLLSDQTLAAIPRKSVGRPVFAFRSGFDLLLVQYGNLLLPPLLVTIAAIVHLRRRRKGMQRIYGA